MAEIDDAMYEDDVSIAQEEKDWETEDSLTADTERLLDL